MRQVKTKNLNTTKKITVNNRLFKFQTPYKNGILNGKIEYGIELENSDFKQQTGFIGKLEGDNRETMFLMKKNQKKN